MFVPLFAEQKSECVLVVVTLDVSWLVSLDVCNLSEEGYVVAKCNKVCCICNGESPLVKVVKSYTR